MASTLLVHDIRGVLFDWGDTLVHPPGLTTDAAGHYGCVEAFFAEDLPEKFPISGRMTSAIWPTFRDHYGTVAQGQIEGTLRTGREHSFQERLARTLGLTFPSGAAPSASELDWMAGRLAARIAAQCCQIKDAEHVLPQLRRRFQVGLLSNYPHASAVHASLERFGLVAHLDMVAVSVEIGWAKPDPRAFTHAIDRMGLAPEQVLYVGDDLVNDMQGAKAFGMQTAWLPRQGQREGDPSIDVTLTELADLVDLLGTVAREVQNR